MLNRINQIYLFFKKYPLQKIYQTTKFFKYFFEILLFGNPLNVSGKLMKNDFQIRLIMINRINVTEVTNVLFLQNYSKMGKKFLREKFTLSQAFEANFLFVDVILDNFSLIKKKETKNVKKL